MDQVTRYNGTHVITVTKSRLENQFQDFGVSLTCNFGDILAHMDYLLSMTSHVDSAQLFLVYIT